VIAPEDKLGHVIEHSEEAWDRHRNIWDRHRISDHASSLATRILNEKPSLAHKRAPLLVIGAQVVEDAGQTFIRKTKAVISIGIHIIFLAFFGMYDG
jgi:hypothetical protein